MELSIPAYTGHWYQIASQNAFWDKWCEYSEAWYSYDKQNNQVKVENLCFDANHTLKSSIKGTATPTHIPTIFTLKFENGNVGQYRVLWTDYFVSFVGLPETGYLSILCRSPQLSRQDINYLDEKARSMGFDNLNWKI